MPSKLIIVPTTRDEANHFISQHHRHHGAVVQSILRCAVADEDGKVRGVAVAGRPIARHLADGFTLEVNRCCTDGAKNACSMLYAAIWRAARALGYNRVITYTLDTEPGTSLVAAGWRVVGKTRAESWHRKSRPRVDTNELQQKLRWEKHAF